jgi:hypothetical protein
MVYSFAYFLLIIGLLEGIGTAKRGVKRKSDFGAKPTAAKYRIAEADSAEEDTSDDASGMEFEEESEFEGISETSDSADELSANTQAPDQHSSSYAIPTGKYIPPAARKAQPSALPARDEDSRLHKQIQGVLNR